MMKDEQIAMLKSDIDAWNQWRLSDWDSRVKKFKTTIDLKYTNLSGALLASVNLSHANLTHANLSDADLSGAYVVKANLTNVRLTHANLTRVILSEANLAHANLSGADLSGAHFDSANLIGTDFKDTNLSDADFSDTNLNEANLNGAYLTNANLSNTDLSNAHLSGAKLMNTNLTGANLTDADLSNADLSGAYMSGAKLMHTNLTGANLSMTDLSNADLSQANLIRCQLVQTNLSGACFNYTYIYGISVWDVILTPTTHQQDLIISSFGEPVITVDNLEIAQFIYLLLNNERIRDVINTMANKAVLILGRFSLERIGILRAIRDELRRQNYLPIVFDFQKSDTRNYTETALALAHLCKFVVADLTDAKSVPQELQAIVPANPSVPIQPLILDSQRAWAMSDDFFDYATVLPPFVYADEKNLLLAIGNQIILPAEEKVKEIQKRRKSRQGN